MRLSVALILVVLGCISLGLASYSILQITSSQHAEQALGTVTENVSHPYVGDYSQDYIYYCPIIQFRTSAGKTIKFEAQDACSELDQPAIYKVGQTVQLHYDPKDPGSALTKSANLDQFAAVGLCGSGGIALMLAGLATFLVKRPAQHTS